METKNGEFVTIDLILEKELKLFDKWKQQREFLCPDGIIDYEGYSKSQVKIMLLLKEANAVDEIVDFKDFLNNGAYERKATWENVLRWLYGIQNIDRDYSWNEIEKLFGNKTIRTEYLKSIIFCNLKKIGGTYTTNNFDFYDICIQDKELIIEQVNLYFDNSFISPDFIIAGGSAVSSTFSEIFNLTDDNWKQTLKGIYYYEIRPQKYFIDFVHPEVRVPPNYVYYLLIDTIREIRRI